MFYAWDSRRDLALRIFGLIVIVVFVTFEEFIASEPLIRLDLFKNRTAAASYFETILHGMILWSTLFYTPLYYEAVKGGTPIIVGTSLFTATSTAAMVTGITITKTGSYRQAIWSG